MRRRALMGAVCILAGLVLGFFVAQHIGETCLEGTFLVHGQWGLTAIGDQTLCGRGLHFGPIVGPTKGI